MGTTYFLVFIAIMLAGLLFFIRKTNADSYLHGKQDDAQDLQELREAYQRNEIEHPAVEAYVGRYMSKYGDAPCEKGHENSFGTAYMANDAIKGSSDKTSYEVH